MADELPDLIAQARKAVDALAKRGTVLAAYLFGSRVEGKADRYSDIDLAVFVREATDWDLRRRAEVVAGVQSEVGDHIQLHIFSERSLREPDPAGFAALILERGIAVPLD